MHGRKSLRAAARDNHGCALGRPVRGCATDSKDFSIKQDVEKKMQNKKSLILT